MSTNQHCPSCQDVTTPKKVFNIRDNPIPFYITHEVPERTRLSGLIELHGGKVVKESNDAQYKLVDPTKTHRSVGSSRLHSYKFVTDSIEANRLMPAIGYELLLTGERNGRIPFSKEDDEYLERNRALHILDDMEMKKQMQNGVQTETENFIAERSYTRQMSPITETDDLEVENKLESFIERQEYQENQESIDPNSISYISDQSNEMRGETQNEDNRFHFEAISTDSAEEDSEDNISISVCLGKRRKMSDERTDDPIQTKRSRLSVSQDRQDQINEVNDDEREFSVSQDQVDQVIDDERVDQVNDDERVDQINDDERVDQVNDDEREDQINDDNEKIDQVNDDEREFLTRVKRLSERTHRPLTDVIRALGVTSCNFEAANDYILGRKNKHIWTSEEDSILLDRSNEGMISILKKHGTEVTRDRIEFLKFKHREIRFLPTKNN
ncbi:8041_t:CDS:2 [Diversispora eburnea]|uniref:DNA-binding protein RAP1 n=1 Tax=Diversispora eburnea TaxID=1213867 RepID=A0A9N8VSC1_9GLOM|nr:8041_t:CDS:2 [Diversispora eburnea]